VAVDFAKTNDKFEIVGGAMGDTVLDVNGIKALAALPSLDELRATIVGLIQAPATKIARTSTSRVPSWHGSSAPTRPKKPRSFSHIFHQRTTNRGEAPPRSIKWLTSPSWSTSFPN
jgi:hypothetical protein